MSRGLLLHGIWKKNQLPRDHLLRCNTLVKSKEDPPLSLEDRVILNCPLIVSTFLGHDLSAE